MLVIQRTIWLVNKRRQCQPLMITHEEKWSQTNCVEIQTTIRTTPTAAMTTMLHSPSLKITNYHYYYYFHCYEYNASFPFSFLRFRRSLTSWDNYSYATTMPTPLPLTPISTSIIVELLGGNGKLALSRLFLRESNREDTVLEFHLRVVRITVSWQTKCTLHFPECSLLHLNENEGDDIEGIRWLKQDRWWGRNITYMNSVWVDVMDVSSHCFDFDLIHVHCDVKIIAIHTR